MKNAAQKPKKESLFLRVRAWLRKRGHRSAPVQSVVMLPRQATLFSGKLMLSLPPDFRPLSSKQDSAQFFGKSSGLHLTVMQTDFSRKLHSLKSTDL
ncbi:MAG: hypothetical protein IKI58_02685 [Oscillospiraceae bacterium]|nr:hypothetical protein [Oscillospiraceae bacterium]